MDLKAQRAAAFEKAQALSAKGVTSAEDIATLESLIAEVKSFDTQIELAAKSASTVAALGALVTKSDDDAPTVPASPRGKSASLGDEFLKAVGGVEGLKSVASRKGELGATDFFSKASPNTTTSGQYSDILTTVTRNVTGQTRESLSIADLLSALSISSNSITYWAEKPKTGGFATNAEGAQKARTKYDFDYIHETVSNLAGLTNITEEMMADADFLVSYINSVLTYDLLLAEEQQLLNGDGNGTNLKGLLNRSGVQSIASANVDDNARSIYKAFTAIHVATMREADGIVINPLDYERERLATDKNGQYFGGGVFGGAYGNGNFIVNQPLWGRPTVVTTAIAQGTVLVGNFKSASVLRRSGVRVEAFRENGTNVETNEITIRAEERLGLMVPKPAAFVKVSLSDAAAV